MAETALVPSEVGSVDPAQLSSGSDRRADVDAKMTQVADLLQQVNCDGLLLLEPENFAWLTSGGTARGQIDTTESPAVYCNGEQRWIMCSNVDTQRLFDEEVDGLGYQLKEWPWHWGREQLLADLCQGRKVACDRPIPDVVPVADQVRVLRRPLSVYEQACLQALGLLVSHALEATCRTMPQGLSEREIAAHVAHRMLHRGVQPIQISVAVDGRSQQYRQPGFTAAQLERYVVVSATGRKYGLHARCARTVCFGPPDAALRKEHDSASKVCAGYLAATWPDAVPREILLAGRRIYLVTGYEHEWVQAPQGYLTGRALVEMKLTPQTEELFVKDTTITWHASAGAGLSCDTFLITDEGPRNMTPTEVWPLKRIRIQGAELIRPDILQR